MKMYLNNFPYSLLYNGIQAQAIKITLNNENKSTSIECLSNKFL